MERFIQLNPYLFRGSAPSIQEVIQLKKQFGINKIISLDKSEGIKIARICHLLGICHFIFPINHADLEPLFKLLSHDIFHLLMDNGPTFFHCEAGKDRTGMLGAMYRCRLEGWTCREAMDEALEIGFGTGLPEKTIKTYTTVVIANCQYKHQHIKPTNINIEENDDNEAREIGTFNEDIASNSRIYDTDWEGSVLDQAMQHSFAPFEDYIRKYPWDSVYQYKYDQMPTRNNHDLFEQDRTMMQRLLDTKEQSQIPQVGLYDNVEGIRGVGPMELGGGFANI
jgi:hypothetical protein